MSALLKASMRVLCHRFEKVVRNSFISLCLVLLSLLSSPTAPIFIDDASASVLFQIHYASSSLIKHITTAYTARRILL